MVEINLQTEFEKQLQTLFKKGYPEAAGLSTEKFIQQVEPLREKIVALSHLELDIDGGKLPFVIVTKSTLIPANVMMSSVERDGRKGISKLFPHQPTDFQTIPQVSLPSHSIYLIVDIDRGKESINVTPHNALEMMNEQQRSPLTIDEGIALVTHYPEFLIKNNCFSLPASRHNGDQRVPAIWINANKEPNLGWCWDGNPHTWLGSASCSIRI